MRILEFEQRLWEVDKLRIVIRATSGTEVEDFTWQISADKGMSVVDYLRTRVYPKVDDIEVIVVAGNGETPRGNTRISNVRLSYEHG